MTPRPGGMGDQPTAFRWLVDYCGAVGGVYASRAAEKAEEEERIQKQKRKAQGRHG